MNKKKAFMAKPLHLAKTVTRQWAGSLHSFARPCLTTKAFGMSSAARAWGPSGPEPLTRQSATAEGSLSKGTISFQNTGLLAKIAGLLTRQRLTSGPFPLNVTSRTRLGLGRTNSWW